MNSKTTLLIAGILAFALLANVSAPVFATGGLDDEEEEKAIEQLQDSVKELKDTLGTIQLNLTTGANDITANCPNAEPEQNITEPPTLPPPQPPTCPFVPPPLPPPPIIQNNVTEIIEEIIENVTEPTCPPIQPPVPPTTIIPGIVLPNITEPVEPTCPPPIQPPVIVVEPPPVVPQCPFAPQTNTTTTIDNNNNLTDGQEIAEIEFDAQCSCFVVDKTPESNNVEQALSQLGN